MSWNCLINWQPLTKRVACLSIGDSSSPTTCGFAKPSTCSKIIALWPPSTIASLASWNVTEYRGWSVTVPSWKRLLRCVENGGHGDPITHRSTPSILQCSPGCNRHDEPSTCSLKVLWMCSGFWVSAMNSLNSCLDSATPAKLNGMPRA